MTPELQHSADYERVEEGGASHSGRCNASRCPCYLEGRRASEQGRQGTHWIGCWRVHHDCAAALLERIVGGEIVVYHDEQGYPRIRTEDSDPHA